MTKLFNAKTQIHKFHVVLTIASSNRGSGWQWVVLIQISSRVKTQNQLNPCLTLFTGSCLAGQPVTDPTMCFKMRPMIICSNCNLGLNRAFEWNPAHKRTISITISIIKSKCPFNRQSIYLLNYNFGGFGGRGSLWPLPLQNVTRAVKNDN